MDTKTHEFISRVMNAIDSNTSSLRSVIPGGGKSRLACVASALLICASSFAQDAAVEAEQPAEAPAVAGLPAVSPEWLGPCLVFDAMRSAGKPPLGLPYMKVDGRLFTRDSVKAFQNGGMRNPWLLELNESAVRRLALDAQQGGWTLCLNIEALPLDARRFDDAAIERSVAVMARAVAVVRQAAPNVRVGYYSMMPLRAYHPTLNNPNAGVDHEAAARADAGFAAWRRANQRLGFSMTKSGRSEVGLADLVDFVCPSIYLFHDDRTHSIERQVRYVRANLLEARQYGKPVYAFVWPKLHGKDALVPMRLWTATIRAAVRDADGIVLWNGTGETWDDGEAIRVAAARMLAESRGDIDDATLADRLREEFGRSSDWKELAGETVRE